MCAVAILQVGGIGLNPMLRPPSGWRIETKRIEWRRGGVEETHPPCPSPGGDRVHPLSTAVIEPPIGNRDARSDREVGMGDEENFGTEKFQFRAEMGFRFRLLGNSAKKSSPVFSTIRPCLPTLGLTSPRRCARSRLCRLCKNQVRNRLSAGGRWIRTIGSGASGEADALLPVKNRPR